MDQVSLMKRKNDDLLYKTANLEHELQTQKEKMLGSEEQLRKLEHKITISDISLANQVGIMY